MRSTSTSRRRSRPHLEGGEGNQGCELPPSVLRHRFDHPKEEAALPGPIRRRAGVQGRGARGEVMTAEIGDLKRGSSSTATCSHRRPDSRRVCPPQKATRVVRRSLRTLDSTEGMDGRGDGRRDTAWEVRAVGVSGVRVTAAHRPLTTERVRSRSVQYGRASRAAAGIAGACLSFR